MILHDTVSELSSENAALRKRVEELEGIGLHYANVIISFRTALEEISEQADEQAMLAIAQSVLDEIRGKP